MAPLAPLLPVVVLSRVWVLFRSLSLLSPFSRKFSLFCLKLPFVFDIVHARTRQIVEALKVFDTFQLLHSAG